MAKISKPLVISFSVFGVLILIVIIMLIPIAGRTFLAKAFDGAGNHKAALGTDLFFQGKANGLLQNLSVNDLSKADQCQNAYKILKNEKLNFLMPIRGQNKTTIKPSFNDKVFLETKFGGVINPTTRKASANLELSTKIDQNSAKEIIAELSTSGINIGSLMPIETKSQVSGFFDINSILFTINKFDLKTSDDNSSNGLSNYYQFDLKNPDAGIEKTRQEGFDEIFAELKNLANIKLDEVMEENTFNQMSQSFCKSVESMRVENVAEVDFEGVKKLVRPISTDYKENALEIQYEESGKLLEKTEKDQKLKNFLYGKYQSYVKIGNGFNKIVPPLNGEKNAFVAISEDEFKKEIDVAVSTKDKNGKPKVDVAKYKEEAKEMDYTLLVAPSQTFIDVNSGDIYGTQSVLTVVFSDKLKKSFSPKFRDLVGDSLMIMSSSWNIQFGDNVKDLNLPTNTKPATDFVKDVGNTDAAKKIQNEIQKITESGNGVDEASGEAGGIDFTNPDQNSTRNSLFDNNNSQPNNPNNSNFGNSLPSQFDPNPGFSTTNPAQNPRTNPRTTPNTASSSSSNFDTTFGGDPDAGTNDALNMGN